VLAGIIVTVGGASCALGAAPTTQPRERQPLLGGVMFPETSLGAKDPAAIILEPKGDKPEKFVMKWRADLNDAGFSVFLTHAPRDGWKGEDGIRLIREFDKYVAKGNAGGAWAIVRKVDLNRILIVTERNGGAAAISMIEKHPKRIAGAVMMSVSPWVHNDNTIKLWRPSKEAWSVPIWTAMPTNIKAGAPMLLLWRRIAAAKPKDALFTLDPRLELSDKEPGRGIAKWISAIAAGKKPTPGVDSQALQETRRYRDAAKQLLAAMQVARPADAGDHFTKAEGPMVLDVRAPDKWRRVVRGERKYDSDERPYVQVYLSPKPGSMLFARANAAKWSSTADKLLDQYERRLADGGFLAVRHSRWQAKGYSLQISSVLWPTRGKWHRWLILVGAGPGKKNSPAAPMVVVMDASDIPDVNTMAAAMKRLLPSVSVTWKGEPTKKSADR
jgi:pimeloyl-ACP methyl ester carboxylesterase